MAGGASLSCNLCKGMIGNEGPDGLEMMVDDEEQDEMLITMDMSLNDHHDDHKSGPLNEALKSKFKL